MTWRAEPASLVRQGGFTLLEITVVLAIVGVLLGIVMARGPFRSDTLAFSAAKARVFDVMHKAQSLSETGGTMVSVVVDTRFSELVVIQKHTRQISRLKGAARLMVPGPNAAIPTRISYLFTADGSVIGPPLMVVLGKHMCLVRFSPITGRITADDL